MIFIDRPYSRGEIVAPVADIAEDGVIVSTNITDRYRLAEFLNSVLGGSWNPI